MGLLMARRLTEVGVSWVTVNYSGWDDHKSLFQSFKGERLKSFDQGLSALMTDLHSSGLIENTLVVVLGEFGRTPTSQSGETKPGRDHNNKGFSLWMAGGGVKGGNIYGATDEMGGEAVKDPVHIHDLHATILRLLGFDHTKLTYRYNGRDFRLTDVSGNIVKGIIA